MYCIQARTAIFTITPPLTPPPSGMPMANATAIAERHATRWRSLRFALTPVAWAWETRLQRAYSPQAGRGTLA
ncbi:hypothetical protein NIES4073_25030 [Kalymmatonema gypsitolerans NIES-4073]|nr:hypothetical protein NIES4073_25030 [Scytonema sp. NIES-4073]